MLDRIGTNAKIEDLFEEVNHLVESATGIPMTYKIVVNSDELLGIMDELRDAIPREVRSASQVLEEQQNIVNDARAKAEEILAKANEEATHIVEAAKAEAERLTRQEEVVAHAEVLAKDIKETAIREQMEIRQSADEYARAHKEDLLAWEESMLSYLDERLLSALNAVHESRDLVNGEREQMEREYEATASAGDREMEMMDMEEAFPEERREED